MLILAGLIAKLAESPLVANVLFPSIVRFLTNFFEAHAKRIELSGAVQAVKGAQNAEQLRLASKRLTDATARK